MPNGIGYEAEQRGLARPIGTTNSPVFILEDSVRGLNATAGQRFMRVDRGVKILTLQVFGTGANTLNIGWTAGINKILRGNDDGYAPEAANPTGLLDGVRAVAGEWANFPDASTVTMGKVFTQPVYITMARTSGTTSGMVMLRLYCIRV